MPRPLIGITTDLSSHSSSSRPTCSVSLAYAQHVARAGGVAVYLPPIQELMQGHLAACDGFIFTGGGDPRTEAFGQPTHAKACVMDQARQAYEVALLRALEEQRPEAPVLGICLGMQLLALVSGGQLNQHLPDTLATHADHDAREHSITPEALPPAAHSVRRVVQEFAGLVASHHRQAVADPGRLDVLALSHDSVIEAVADPTRPFCLGVQWHPERTRHTPLGQHIFDGVVQAATWAQAR